MKIPTVSGSNCSPATFSRTEGVPFLSRDLFLQTIGLQRYLALDGCYMGGRVYGFLFFPKAGEVEHTEFPVSIDDL
ncbi:MAG: hypothetical protein DRI93_01860 [Aquificota bacterium]|nr:MAG: hypothetical protein DRI93_01860 [Aquificota bacterium]RLD97910.1 MAG: hypothetical protein DRI91_04235 [Aquificota bacterium]